MSNQHRQSIELVQLRPASLEVQNSCGRGHANDSSKGNREWTLEVSHCAGIGLYSCLVGDGNGSPM